MKKKTSVTYAFTLAEVLITLGIIGVVAALTLPSLVQNYEEKATVTRLKKTYSILNQAYLSAVNEHSSPEHWGLVKSATGTYDENGNQIFDYTSSKLIREYLSKYLKGENCTSVNECLNKDTLTFLELNRINSNSNRVMSNTPAFKLVDGTILLFGNITSPSCSGSARRCSDILVLFPNKHLEFRKGVNDFMFYLAKTGIYPHGMENTAMYSFTNSCTFTGAAPYNNGHGCTAWVLQNENMDYLHCREQLSWDGKHSCK